MAIVAGTNSSETVDARDGVSNDADEIRARGGADRIFGLGGDDFIKGGGGADTIDGGIGSDTASYSDSAVGVLVSLITGLGFAGTAEGDHLTNIENLSGSAHDDMLIGDDDANILFGDGGHDFLEGGGGADALMGSSGNDTLKGGGGADFLDGGSGVDTATYADSSAGVFVSLYDDIAAGGHAEGDDLIFIENVTGSAYHDDLWGDNNANTLKGNDGDDTLKGYGGADTLDGGDGNDTLYGMDGADTLKGGNGNDTFVFKAGQANGDFVHEFAGNGAAAGDVLKFQGYGTVAEGATFRQLTATEWQITSANGLIQEVINVTAGSSIDTTTDLIFV
jgi:Ca2+-binding RTX toxin-like protein